MKRKFAVIVFDRVTGVAASLESDDDIARFGEHIGYLALAFIAPISTYYCCNHKDASLLYVNLRFNTEIIGIGVKYGLYDPVKELLSLLRSATHVIFRFQDLL